MSFSKIPNTQTGRRLTWGPGQFLPSDSTQVLWYGSGPCSGFLAKVLGVNTQLFVCNTRFYFSRFLLLLHKSRKRRRHFVLYLFGNGAGDPCSVPSCVNCLITMSLVESVRFIYLFKFSYFFPFHLHLRTGGAHFISQR